MSINEITLFRISLGLYLASLVLPADGTWFAGVLMLFFSAFASIVLIATFDIDSFSNPKTIFGVFMMLMPFYNVFFICAALRFRSFRKPRYGVFNICFFTCTLVALVWGSIAVIHDAGKMYLLTLWSLAFLFLSVAKFLKNEKDLTNVAK